MLSAAASSSIRDQIRIPNRGTDVPLLICGIVEVVSRDQFAIGTLHGPVVAQVPRPSISPQNDLAAPGRAWHRGHAWGSKRAGLLDARPRWHLLRSEPGDRRGSRPASPTF